MSTDSDPNCAPGDGQIQGNRGDVRVAECPVGIPEECGAMDDMDNKSNDALGGALDMGSSGDSEENECGRNDEEDNSEGAELSMKYPGTALKRKLDLKWKRMVTDAAIEAKGRGDEGYLSTIARQVWPETRNFPPDAYYCLRGQARLEYQQAKKLFEPRKKTAKKWTEMRLAGKYDGIANARARAGEGGRNCKFKELKEMLYDYFVHAKSVLGGRVGSNLMQGKAQAMVAANKEQFAGEGGITKDGGVDAKWLKHFLRRFYEEYQIVKRAKNHTVKCSASEIERRLGAFWRNIIRVRVHFAPEEIKVDAFDHTPVYRRMNKGKMLATLGAEQVGAKEDNAGEKSRFTVILYASSDGVPKAPEVLMKGSDPARMKDIQLARLPTNISFRVSPSATYDAGTSMEMIRDKYCQWHLGQMLSPRKYRILVMCQFAGKLRLKSFPRCYACAGSLS